MKSILASALILTSVHFASAATIDNSVFNKVANIAGALHYGGNDVLACFDRNQQLRLGGTSHWSLGLQLFIVRGQAGPTPLGKMTQDLSKSTNGLMMFQQGPVSLALNTSNMGFQTTSAILFEGGGPEPLNCFMRRSGLE